MTRRLTFLILFAAGTFMYGLSAAQSQKTRTAPLALLAQPGHHAIIRHALAPGTGDPQAVIIGDCSTQRNLSNEGRQQAGRLGAQLKVAGVTPTKILTSQWCRCNETGELLGLGSATGYVPLNSVWTEGSAVSQERAQSVLEMLKQLSVDDKLIMVTHAVNISAITGRSAASGGGYVIKIKNGAVKIVGDIPAP